MSTTTPWTDVLYLETVIPYLIYVLFVVSLACPTFLTLQATANVAGLQLGFRLGLFIEATNAGLIISLVLEVWVVANHAAKLF